MWVRRDQDVGYDEREVFIICLFRPKRGLRKVRELFSFLGRGLASHDLASLQ